MIILSISIDEYLADFITSKQRTSFPCRQSFPTDKPPIHDICLSFSFKHLLAILSAISSSPLIKNIDKHSNKDTTLQDIDLGDGAIKTTIHNNSTVYVIVASILNPIPIDYWKLLCQQAVISSKRFVTNE